MSGADEVTQRPPGLPDAVQALRHRLSDASIVVDGADDAPGLWFGTGRRPGVRVECADAADVSAAVLVAADHGIPVAVWGGRRDSVGRNAGEGQIVIDLRRHRSARFDPDARTISVGGGTTTGDVLAGLPYDQVTATTSVVSVGIVGTSVGGGYGPLTNQYGLVADQLLSARLVLADGSLVEASAEADADLLWGLKGGGTGFGVITEATFATHALDRVLNAIVVVPAAGAAHALTIAQELLDTEPQDLSVTSILAIGPDGQPSLSLVVYWSGGAERGEQTLHVLERLPDAVTVMHQWMPYAESFVADEDTVYPSGQQWRIDTSTIPRFDLDVAQQLVESARAMPGPGTMLAFHDFHGTATRVAPDATAFPLRRPHHTALIRVPDPKGDEVASHRARDWADQTQRGLAPFALPGGYVNYLGPDNTDRVAAFYGNSLPRLAKLKDRVDPDRLFRHVTGVGSLA